MAVWALALLQTCIYCSPHRCPNRAPPFPLELLAPNGLIKESVMLYRKPARLFRRSGTMAASAAS